MTKIAVIGGGLAGISAAKHAVARGYEVELFESSGTFGGRISSISYESGVFDRGFQVVNMKYPELKTLIGRDRATSRPIFTTLNFLDKNGIGSDISPTNVRSLFSSKSGSLVQKLNFLKYLLTKIEGSDSLGKASHKFEDLYNRVLSPFLSGVFLSDPRNIRGDVAKQILRYFLIGRPHLIDGGVSNLIPALLHGIPNRSLHLNSKVMKIHSGAGNDRLTIEVNVDDTLKTFSNFDFVIVATNGKVGEIGGTSGGNSREWLASTTVYHEMKKLPRESSRLFVASSFVNSLVISNANPTYASNDKSLIATTYLGEIFGSLWEETKVEREAAIAALYECDPGDLKLVSIQSIRGSLPLFPATETSGGKLPIVDPLNARIFYAGDAFDEPSQNGALRSGRVAIEEIAKLIGAPRQD